MPHSDRSFKQGSQYTLGVEIEFQILDHTSYSLTPLAPTLINYAPEILRPRLSLEFIKSILEIQTGICTDVGDVENDLLQTCSLAEELAEENGCLLYAASLHPFARASEQELSDGIRYRRIMDELQLLGRRFISQGMHVHVGVLDGDTAARVMNVMQAFLPVFLALSTSSPFFQAKETGLMSYRTKLFEVLPLAGLYEHLHDWDSFCTQIEKLQNFGIIESIRDLWWDARPNPDFGTVEIRICDLPTRFTDILSLVALVQSCVCWISEEQIAVEPLPRLLLQANKWQAVRYGLEGRFVDPTGIIGTKSMNFRLAAMLLKKKCLPFAAKLNGLSQLAPIDAIIAGGTGADLQRSVYRQTNSFENVIREVHQGFWK